MSLLMRGPGAAAMKQLAQKLRLASQAQREMAQNLAETGLSLVQESMAAEQDPWGNAWAPLVLRDGQIGRDSGGMQQSLHVADQGPRGFTLAFSKHYAGYFHGGTGIYGPTGQRIRPKTAKALAFGVRGAKRSGGFIGPLTRGQARRAASKKTKFGPFASVKGSPARPLLPEGGNVPPRWERELKDTADAVIHRVFGK